MLDPTLVQESPSKMDGSKEPSEESSAFFPLPATSKSVTLAKSIPLGPLVCDEQGISRLLGLILSQSGMTLHEVATRLGVSPEAVRQYIKGRRPNPSIKWITRFVEVCGGKVMIDLPKNLWTKGAR